MTVFLFIFFLLLSAYGLLFDYYRRSWNAIPEYVPSHAANVKVSVIVAIRNEEKNIGTLLSCFLLQDYPKNLFEIIIVDDHSTDASEEKCNERCSEFNKGSSGYDYFIELHYIKLEEGFTSKKTAISAGVQIATGDLIITTDADCTMPASWISTVASYFEKTGAKFIASPVLMHGGRSMLSIFQSLDFLTLQGITGASVYKNVHSMCNGANLAYSKNAFMEVGGFEGIDNIPSGDDMLLMHKIFNKYPRHVYYLKNNDAIIKTSSEQSFNTFFNQRIRWASKAAHYKDKKIFYVLLLTYFVNGCFLILAISAFIQFKWLLFLLLFLLAKIIIEFPFVNSVAMFFGQTALMVYFPFLQPVHIIYTIIAGWLGRFGSYQWKSRIIKNN